MFDKQTKLDNARKKLERQKATLAEAEKELTQAKERMPDAKELHLTIRMHRDRSANAVKATEQLVKFYETEEDPAQEKLPLGEDKKGKR